MIFSNETFGLSPKTQTVDVAINRLYITQVRSLLLFRRASQMTDRLIIESTMKSVKWLELKNKNKGGFIKTQ